MIITQTISQSFLPYIGADIQFGKNQAKLLGIIHDEPHIFIVAQSAGLRDSYYFKDFPDVKLVLRSLEETFSDDLAMVAQILGFTHEQEDNGRAFIKQILKKERMALNFHPLNVLSVFQFLQSRKYDIPQVLLNGQTLKEAGLATYEIIAVQS